ncbi:LamG domain-containing protein [Streptomyces sp. NPDC005281]|uniref:LamG domain-containing protein n=1 Tax=Streptomyces sp. NPDC005281 TaxID=3155712 RepID=UPI0033A3A86A
MTVPPGFPLDDNPLIATYPRVLVQIAWNAGGNSTAPNHWYTVSKRLRGNWKATVAGRQYELDTVTSGSMTFALDNLDGAFDPDNSASFFYPYVLPYRRARLVWQVQPSRNLLYSWITNGTDATSLAASAGTISVATGLSASLSGLTTAHTWAVPNATGSGAVFGFSGATRSWASFDCEGTTVTPGASYAAGIDLQLASGGMSSLGLQLRMQFYSLTGTLLGSATSSATSITTSWARLNCAGTAPAGAAFAVVSIATTATTTSATTVRATGWQLEQAAAATGWAGSGSWVQLWQGFVERWPQSYDKNGKYGLVDVTAVDALAPLSQLTYQNVMPGYASAIQPGNLQCLYDLAAPGASPDVPAGSAFLPYAGAQVGTGGLDIVGANIVTGASITSTSDLGTLWGVPGPVTTLSSNQAAALGTSAGATYLAPWDGTDRLMLPNGGWTRVICFRTTNQPGTGGRFNTATLWAATGPGYITGSGNQSVASLEIYNTGQLSIKLQNAGNTASCYVLNPVSVCDGNWHCAVISLSSDGKTARLVVDGVFSSPTAAASMGSSTYTVDAIGAMITTNGENTSPFNGDIAFFGQWNTELDAVSEGEMTRGFALGWSGDAVSTRIARLLSLAAFHPGSAASFSYLGSQGTLGAMDLNGRTALDAIQESADTENGQFSADRNGNPSLHGHLWRWIQNTPVATFGENLAGGEIPVKDDIKFEQDPAHLYNDIQVTCDGASDATDVTRMREVQDATSQAAYFPQTLTRTINPQSVVTGLGMANYLLSLYKDPHTRLQTLTVDLAHSPSVQVKVSKLNFADLVRVMKRPTLAPAKQIDGFIEQMEWSGDDTGAVLQLRAQISPNSQYRYWIISAAWAALTTSPASGVSVITVGPVSGNNSIAAQAVIPAGFTMVLGYGTANVETVTVQSVQTVSAGYSTVQLTLAAPTTKSHTAGDVICSPLPGSTLPPGGSYPSCFDAAALFGGTSPLFGFG